MNKNSFIALDYKNKIALSALLFVLAAAGLAYFLVMPSLENIKRMKTETENQILEAEKNYLAGKSLKKTAEKLKTVEPRLGELERIFIKKDNESALDFFAVLEKTAASNNVAETVSLGAEQAMGQSYGRNALKMETRGDFTGQMNFLAALESLPYYINIGSLELSAIASGQDPAEEGGKKIVMKISADTYWRN